MFTRKELKMAMEKYKVDTSFIDEIPLWIWDMGEKYQHGYD